MAAKKKTAKQEVVTVSVDPVVEKEKESPATQVDSVDIKDVSMVSAVVKNGVAVIKGKTADGKSFAHEMVMKDRYGASFSLK